MCHPQASCEDFECKEREKVSCSCGTREEEIVCGDIEASANETRAKEMKLEEREAELQPDESKGREGMPAGEEDLSKTGANNYLHLSADGLLPCNEECVMESFKGFLRKILMQAEQEETEEKKMEASRRGPFCIPLRLHLTLIEQEGTSMFSRSGLSSHPTRTLRSTYERTSAGKQPSSSN